MFPDFSAMLVIHLQLRYRRSIKYLETPSEGHVPSEEIPFSPPVFDVTSQRV